MNDAIIMHMAEQGLLMAAKLAAPILLVSLIVGLVVSFIQSITQLQEVTLTFVPKLIGISLVLIISGHWMLGQLTGFIQTLFDQVPGLLGG